jgi:ribosomal protein L16/L10AE
LVFSKSKYWSALPQKFAKTSKTVGARMGSGKGLVFAYVYKIIKGSIILEWTGSYIAPQELTFFSLLPVKFKIIKKSL